MDPSDDDSSSSSEAVQGSSPSVSPPTSPEALSPPTSPALRYSAGSSTSSSSCASPRPKRLRTGNPYRTTLRRRRARAECDQVDSSDDDRCLEINDNNEVQQIHIENMEHVDNSNSDSSSSNTEGLRSGDSSDRNPVSEDSDNGSIRSDTSNQEHSISGDSDDGSEDDGNPMLYEGSQVSKFQANFEVLHLYVKERWSKSSLNSTLKLMKSLLPTPNELPSSSTHILKWLEEFTSVGKESEFYYCSSCRSSLKHFDEKCTCGCEVTDVFYSFPLEDQIKYLFENRDLASIIDHHNIHHGRKEGHICDIQDGTEYQDLKRNVTGQYDLVLLWNTDGVSLSLSSKQELWPILSTICELPPRIRSSFMIVSGIFVGRQINQKPNMNVYLKPFVDSLKQISVMGGVSWVHPVSHVSYKSLVVAPVLCADAPAKAIVLNMKYFSARFGCNVCEQKAQRVDPDPNEENPKKRRRRSRLVFQEEAARERTGQRMDEQGVLAEARGKSRKGVLGPAVVSDIPFFDRGSCICADYLHIVLQGTVKYFFNLIFHVSGPWYLGDKTADVDRFLEEIKVPDYIKRLVRSILELKFYKGSEYRAFLLYYSLPLFKKLGWPEAYLQHWLMFVAAISILLKDAIAPTELDAAEVMLRCFVRDVKHLYSERYYTYNLHNLLHLPLLVKRWGPLWATSSFPFENYNGYISNHIHGTKHLGKELLNTIKIMQSVSILRNVVNNTGQRVFMTHNNSIALVGKKLQKSILSDHEEAVLSEAGLDTYNLYSRGKVGRNLCSTKMYDDNKKRANSYIQFNSPNGVKYGQVLYYVKASDDVVYCVVRVFKVNHLNIFVHLDSMYQLRNIVPIKYTEDLSVIKFGDIVVRTIKVGDFLCIPPNTYEINL